MTFFLKIFSDVKTVSEFLDYYMVLMKKKSTVQADRLLSRDVELKTESEKEPIYFDYWNGAVK